MWSRYTTSWPETAVYITTSSLSSNPSLSRTTKRTSQKNKQFHPRAFQSRAYISWKESCVHDWLKQLKKLPEPPTSEHMAFLRRVVERCRQEHERLKDPRCQEYDEEPVRDCLLGIPGAGRSSCIKLLQFFRGLLALGRWSTVRIAGNAKYSASSDWGKNNTFLGYYSRELYRCVQEGHIKKFRRRCRRFVSTSTWNAVAHHRRGIYRLSGTIGPARLVLKKSMFQTPFSLSPERRWKKAIRRYEYHFRRRFLATDTGEIN